VAEIQSITTNLCFWVDYETNLQILIYSYSDHKLML